MHFCAAFSSFVVLCRGRVGLMPDGSLYFEVPKETDFGVYTCQATNHLGSTSLSFQVQKAGKRDYPETVHMGHLVKRLVLYKIDEFMI